jgi:hypothetical protein
VCYWHDYNIFVCPFSHLLVCLKLLLELVFLDVWSPALNSVRRNSYYVSFIDDFSKFTWIFLLRHKSHVFAKFHLFQQHVKHLLNKKISVIQIDWGGEYEIKFLSNSWDFRWEYFCSIALRARPYVPVFVKYQAHEYAVSRIGHSWTIAWFKNQALLEEENEKKVE